jgi:hypothetical protein
LAQVARALAHAHQAGLVHRDLSSANVFLCDPQDDGPPLAKVLDFGVTKVLGEIPIGRVQTGDGKVLGSPQYMSPEQAKGAEGVDARTDVWSFGVLAYQCLSGKLPFDGPNYNALLFAILHAPHAPLSSLLPRIDPELSELVESCLVKDRDVREGSILPLAEQLEQLALRLAREYDRPRYVPLRRRADRINPTKHMGQARWIARRALAARALPRVTRLAQHLQAVPRSVMLAMGLLLGAGGGILGAKLLLPQAPLTTSSTPLPQSVCETPERELDREISLGAAQPNTQEAKAAAKESDLVKAMARGLDVSARSGTPAGNPSGKRRP